MKPLTWRALNNQLSMMTEQEAYTMLEEELANQRRASVIQRLHQRANVLRVSRERLEILKMAVKP
jgi:hypothetical protein